MSVDVMTVRGPVPAADIGVTLMHEHLFVDARPAVSAPADEEAAALLHEPVQIGDLALLRDHPYASLDNCLLNDVGSAAVEVSDFARRGGRTIVDVTPEGIGRSPGRLREVAERTGVNVVMGCGLYVERAHPAWARRATVAELTERFVADCRVGVDGVRAGLIGEIGVSPAFSESERRALVAAARAQRETHVPLMVHLPAWQRRAHEVLDACAAEGVPPGSVVLAHLDPAAADRDYLLSLAGRGARLEFDGIGMGLFFEGEGQAPSDAEIAAAVAELIGEGYGGQVLLSHDVFLKVQLRRCGGNGYAHVLRSFLPRLERLGIEPALCTSLVTDNPRRLFEDAALH